MKCGHVINVVWESSTVLGGRCWVANWSKLVTHLWSAPKEKKRHSSVVSDRWKVSSPFCCTWSHSGLCHTWQMADCSISGPVDPSTANLRVSVTWLELHKCISLWRPSQVTHACVLIFNNGSMDFSRTFRLYMWVLTQHNLQILLKQLTWFNRYNSLNFISLTKQAPARKR